MSKWSVYFTTLVIGQKSWYGEISGAAFLGITLVTAEGIIIGSPKIHGIWQGQYIDSSFRSERPHLRVLCFLCCLLLWNTNFISVLLVQLSVWTEHRIMKQLNFFWYMMYRFAEASWHCLKTGLSRSPILQFFFYPTQMPLAWGRQFFLSRLLIFSEKLLYTFTVLWNNDQFYFTKVKFFSLDGVSLIQALNFILKEI